jgi:hypothetical protein
MLSGTGLCDKLITRPKESYRRWCVVVCDLETSWMRRLWPTGGLLRQKQKTNMFITAFTTAGKYPLVWGTQIQSILSYSVFIKIWSNIISPTNDNVSQVFVNLKNSSSDMQESRLIRHWLWRLSSCGMWRRVVWYKLADLLKKPDVHGSVHHNTNLIEITNKIQLCRTIYYSIFPWLLNMFRAILSLIIRSF